VWMAYFVTHAPLKVDWVWFLVGSCRRHLRRGYLCSIPVSSRLVCLHIRAVLCAHPVCGASCIQHRAYQEFETQKRKVWNYNLQQMSSLIQHIQMWTQSQIYVRTFSMSMKGEHILWSKWIARILHQSDVSAYMQCL